MNDTTPALPDLSPVESCEIIARFDDGILLLRELELQLKFADMIARCMEDERNPASIIHSQAGMIRERIFVYFCGYEGCNDMNTLRHDPALKMA